MVVGAIRILVSPLEPFGCTYLREDRRVKQKELTMTKTTHWMPSSGAAEIDCLCIGTGRFLRSVLVPALNGGGFHPALVQTRGRSFLEFMSSGGKGATKDGKYEVDTVLESGEIQTDEIACFGAFSFGLDDDKKAFYDSLPQMKSITLVGLGVTEAGLASTETKVMKDLYELFQTMRGHIDSGTWNVDKKICVINMDNVPNNGSVVARHMKTLAADDADMLAFLNEKLAFLDSMVDRITSQREGSNGMVPRAEPVPAKALVLLDPSNDLPPVFHELKQYGIVVRTTAAQLQADIALKLRIANGTHTAIAHSLALLLIKLTDRLSKDDETAVTLMKYLDELTEHQILQAGAPGLAPHSEEAKTVYQDWRKRLIHPHFGLSSFFITQNGPAKGGIRLGPTVQDLIVKQKQPVTVAMAFAFAALLRWLTPAKPVDAESAARGIYTGWLQGSDRKSAKNEEDATEYADKLRYHEKAGWYEFRCACTVQNDYGQELTLSEWLGSVGESRQPAAFFSVIRSYLTAETGGNLGAVSQSPQLDCLVKAVSTLYARLVAGDEIVTLLSEMKDSKGLYKSGFATECSVLVDDAALSDGRPLHYRASPIPQDSAVMKLRIGAESIQSVVVSEVASALAIDLHTHLLPPTHGPLCLWGIDELLTYHYLVAEYFMTAPASISPESFYARTKQEQADIIWQALFIDRSPVSEACRGVITTLVALGLSSVVRARDLGAIRAYYKKFRDEGIEGAEKFSSMIHSLAGVRYNIMTNIPFEPNEVQHWRPKKKDYSDNYRTALRVDPLLVGDKNAIESALKSAGYEPTRDGARQYLRDWCDTLKPEYAMASTPHNFVVKDGTLADVVKTGLNEDALRQPGAFAQAAAAAVGATCDTTEDDAPSLLDENSDFLSEVLMKVCEERDLPVALKIGCHRGVNPALKSAGDGVVAFADAGTLGRLCTRFPRVRFLATFLSRNNQHEACVLASKFRNLHIYGCWWFCNNPSIIKEITQMRVEMLGTAFTAQHSDARVLDQLLYKWPHSRALIAGVLRHEFAKLIASGWRPTRSELRRDVGRLFGASYEEFMDKSLLVLKRPA